MNIKAKVYDKNIYPWNKIRTSILQMEQDEFKEKAFSEEDLQNGFTTEENTAVLLFDDDTQSIIGFTYAVVGSVLYNNTLDKKTAYVEDTIIEKKYRGKKLIGIMMKKLEEELTGKGFKFLERDALEKNNYAANIRKHYGSRIKHEFSHDSIYGPQVFFRIKLND
jgi:GNAT superfamily N-acetyltransferase